MRRIARIPYPRMTVNFTLDMDAVEAQAARMHELSAADLAAGYVGRFGNLVPKSVHLDSPMLWHYRSKLIDPLSPTPKSEIANIVVDNIADYVNTMSYAGALDPEAYSKLRMIRSEYLRKNSDVLKIIRLIISSMSMPFSSVEIR